MINSRCMLALAVIALSVSSCEDVVDALSGVETPIEIDNGQAPADSPIDPDNPERYVPQIDVQITPNPSSSVSPITDNEVQVTVTVTNADENPDPALYTIEYGYEITHSNSNIPSKQSQVLSSNPSFSISNLNEGEHTLTVLYKLSQAPDTLRQSIPIVVDAFQGTTLLLQQEGSMQNTIWNRNIWLENVTDLAACEIVVSWTPGAFQYEDFVVEGDGVLFDAETLVLHRILTNNSVSISLSAVNEQQNGINGSGLVGVLQLRRVSSFNGEVNVSITNTSEMRSVDNSPISIDAVNEITEVLQ